jgi:hypothetical protein
MGFRPRGDGGPDASTGTRAGNSTSAWRLSIWLGVVVVAFAAGRFSAIQNWQVDVPQYRAGLGNGDGRSRYATIQDPNAQPYAWLFVQNPGQNDPRELIPMPGPGQLAPLPGMPQESLPGDGSCPLYFFHDGQFFEFQPGMPGAAPFGERNGEGDPELFPLDPAPGAPRPRQEPPRQPPPAFRIPGVAGLPYPAPLLPVVWPPR